MTDIIITCVSNEDNFTKTVYDYLCAQLEKQKRLEEGRNLRVAPDLVRLVAGDDEIHIDKGAFVPKAMIKWILESYLKSNPARFKEYAVIEFGDTFTIGRILHPSQIEMLTCEICGFFTPYSAELHTHRMTHFGL